MTSTAVTLHMAILRLAALRMTDALERFFNSQMDMDWSWGPLLAVRPPRHVRLTLRFWLRLLGRTILISLLLGGPVAACFVAVLIYYDFESVQRHEPKIPPVTVTEDWLNSIAPGSALSAFGLALTFALLWCFPQHWAWNRRAERLNREPKLDRPVLADVSGVWPPPPKDVS